MRDYNREYDSSIEKEFEFIEFVGYHVEECKTSGNWLIVDANDKEVGSLIVNGNIYHTIIDSDTIHYDNEGELTGWCYKTFSYEVKDKGMASHRLTKNSTAGTCRCLKVKNDKMTIYIEATASGSDMIEVSYRYEENGYEIHHNMEYSYKMGRYTYSIFVFDKSVDRKLKTHYFLYTNPPTFNYDPTKSLTTAECKDDDCTEFEFNGSVEELAINHQKGIELLNKVREIVNEFIPHKGDVIDDLFSKKVVDYCHLNIFFPNCKKEYQNTR